MRVRAMIAVVAVSLSTAARADEEAALKAAARHVAPAVVRIETLGGEAADLSQSSADTASGVVVHEDGWIVASAASFQHNPTTILAVLHDGKRLAAKRVATDHSRQLVLLKVEPASKLHVADVAPASELRVGQWAVALGRAIDAKDVNVAVGVVSAIGRVWGKAIQTDAKISPHNLGGPLVDVRGRIAAIITDLPLDGAGGTEGDELYDSGIGFAIPWQHVSENSQRLSKGDLKPGKLGITLASADIIAEAKVAACPAGLPANKAGLRAGDLIVSVNGAPIERIAQFREKTGPLYAGDRVRIGARRGAGDKAKTIEVEIELVAELPPYMRAALGVLPKREGTGLILRHIFKGGPAEKAGLLPGDRITAIDDAPIVSRDDAAKALAALAPGDVTLIKFERDGKSQSVDVSLGRPSERVVEELTPHDAPAANEKPQPANGMVPIKLPQAKNAATVYASPRWAGRAAMGMFVWPVSAPGESDEELLKPWKTHCEERGFLMLIARSAEAGKWSSADREFLHEIAAHVGEKYGVDKARVALFASGSDGQTAWQAAFTNRKLYRGLVAVEATLPPMKEIPETEPLVPLAIHNVRASDSRQSRRIDAGLARLRKAEYTVTEPKVIGGGMALNDAARAEIARWADSLDSL